MKAAVFVSPYKNLELWLWHEGKLTRVRFRNGQYRTKSPRLAASVSWAAATQHAAKVTQPPVWML